ncbi:MAG: hypothetical protein HN353_02870 [Bdellovibrionales bacterium]|jgi:hypothetical protein|nr:hypothetical protein [Bdellovibrionales bacterium]MBT3527152.1 hypothetical protein [Bdellovibrionales bacterium]MBT7670382.1 hypothetical protein [Bdellovibrionales bacterium]MBT7765540.1 hypothetical protein [Bdellovibrionales bacterium]
MNKSIAIIITISLLSFHCFGKNGMPEIDGASGPSNFTPKQLLSYIKNYQRDYDCPTDRIITEGKNITGTHVFGAAAGSAYLGAGFVCGLTAGIGCLGIPLIMGGAFLVEKLHSESSDELYQRNSEPVKQACEAVDLDAEEMDDTTQAVWRRVCIELGTLTNIFSESLHESDQVVTPNFSYPVKLNESFLSWKSQQGDLVTNLSPLILLRDQMRADSDEKSTICLSDKKTSKQISSNLNLTLKEATDIITDQIVRY